MCSPKLLVHRGTTACAIALASAIAIVGSSGRAAAQECTPESVAERPGQWSERPPDLALARDVAPPARHSAILKRIEPIAAMFREAYPEPRGTEAAGYASIRRDGPERRDWIELQAPDRAPGPLPYGYVSLYKTWLCPERTKQPVLADETGNWAYVQVNSLNNLLHAPGAELEIAGKPVFELARRIGNLRGETVYEALMALSYSRGLVLTRDGQYPWKPVSQKQYLDATAEYQEKQFAAWVAAGDESERLMEEQLAETKRTMTGELREQLVASMEQSIAELKAQRPQSDAMVARSRDEELGYIREYRASHSEQEMQQPAIVASVLGVFRGFMEESEGGRLVVQLDPAFFRSDLAPEAAQIIVLLWRWEGENPDNPLPYVGPVYPASDAWRRSFESRFPIDRLRALLDR